MPSEKTPFNNKARIRRIKIVNAARKLFFKNGYKGTTIANIAKQAEYSKRAVYLDFKTKDDLFVTICMEGLEIQTSGSSIFHQVSTQRLLVTASQYRQMARGQVLKQLIPRE